MNPSERSRRLVTMLRQIAPESELGKLAESLEAGTKSAQALETLDAGRPGGNEQSFALETLDVLVRNGIESPLDAEQQESLEAIILPRYRPVVDIVDDTFAAPPAPWDHLGTGENRRHIERVIPSIGRIEVPGHPQLPYAGTGFVVGTDLLMTNRHVAEIFAKGLGQRKLSFRPGQVAGIDFKQEVLPSEPSLLTVREIVMIHPYWDMALIRVMGLPASHPVLQFSVAHPTDRQDLDVVVIGYPAQDWRNDQNLQNRIFRGIFHVKRLQPGKLRESREIQSFGHQVNAVTHDSSTLGGNSGSAVIEVLTGEVVGLHFAGKYLDANYAVPGFALAQDSRVVDAGVHFAGRLDPRGDFYGPIWIAADAPESIAAENDTSRPNVRSPSTPGQPTKSTASSPDSTAGIVVALPSEGMLSRSTTTESWGHFSSGSLNATRFDWQTALSTAVASKLSYEKPAVVTSTALNTWGFESCEFIETDGTQCFVASSPAAVLVAFRGSESLGDWLANLNMISTARSYGSVHRGFLAAFQLVDSQLSSVLTRFAGRPIFLTGHSLGGALATIAAAEWQGRIPISRIYTFGQPAVGKGNFLDFIAQHYAGKLFRFVNDDDIVPRVPPTYHHVGSLIHFDAFATATERSDSAGIESFVDSTQPKGNSVVGPPMLAEAEFDRLRAQLLQQRARASEMESLETPVAEGFFPSLSDHSLDRYIAKIAAKTMV